MPPARRRAVEHVLAAVARHYRQCARAGHVLPPPPALAARIDAAFAALSGPSEASPRATLASLASLRLALYPQQTPTGRGRDARH